MHAPRRPCGVETRLLCSRRPIGRRALFSFFAFVRVCPSMSGHVRATAVRTGRLQLYTKYNLHASRYGVCFLSVHTPSCRDSSRTPTYLPCSIRARVASDMIVGQVRGSLLTLTIVNLSWHAMEVSIQETTVAVRRGIMAAALGSQAIEPGCLWQSCPPLERTANAWRK